MNVQNIPTTNKGYIMYKGIIYACTINEVRSIFETCERKEYTDVILGNNKTETIKGIPAIYKSEDACAKGTEPIKTINICYNHIGWGSNEGYAFGADGIEKVYLDKMDFVLRYNNGSWSMKPIGYKRTYKTMELCEADNDIKVVETDGTTHVRKSLSSMIALTDEQKALLRDVMTAINKCKDAGITLLCNRYENSLVGINTTDIDYTTDYEEREDDMIRLSHFIEDDAEIRLADDGYEKDSDYDLYGRKK